MDALAGTYYPTRAAHQRGSRFLLEEDAEGGAMSNLALISKFPFSKIRF
jgi:hypothetical protein